MRRRLPFVYRFRQNWFRDCAASVLLAKFFPTAPGLFCSPAPWLCASYAKLRCRYRRTALSASRRQATSDQVAAIDGFQRYWLDAMFRCQHANGRFRHLAAFCAGLTLKLFFFLPYIFICKDADHFCMRTITKDVSSNQAGMVRSRGMPPTTAFLAVPL
jgi:hypothetical protein